MQRNNFWSRLSAAAVSALLVIVPQISIAQTVAPESPTTTTPATAIPSEAVTTTVTSVQTQPVTFLDPFVVQGSEDAGSYKATSSLAGTRIRTDLNDIASPLTVVTGQFLQDTGATNSQDLLTMLPNMEVGGLTGNFSGQNGSPIYTESLINPDNVTRVRGLEAADNTRNYFLTDIPWDSFDTGRIDVQRGPNSILFGAGSPGGIINNSTNDAEYVNSTKVINRVSSYGSLRDSLDTNYVLIPNQLAIRFSWVNDNENYQEAYAFNNSTRYYGALRYDPNIFGKDNHTSLRASLENGEVSSNNPRSLPPVDEITPWFASGTNAYGNPGLNKATVNQYTGLDGTNNNPQFLSSLWEEGRTYYPDVLSYFNGASASGALPGVVSNIPTNVQLGALETNIAGLDYYRPMGIPPFSLYAANATVPIPGGSYYSDKVLTDPSIFNFYDNLLDGPNKKEWQNWTALNVSLSQTFLDDRIGLEGVYDRQRYTGGEVQPLQGENYAISVDVNDTFSDGTPNPNVGRPYVANSYWTGDDSTTTTRDSLRFTATAELRSDDFLPKGIWTDILGRSVFTGLMEEDIKYTDALQWNQYATTAEWAQTIGETADSLGSYRQFDWVDYLGPTLINANSASGANLSPITTLIAPYAQSQVNYFNTTYNAPGVSMTAPYTYRNPATGQTVTTTQADNPANYVGWTPTTVSWLNANNPTDFPDLVTGAQKYKYADISRGITWQGYLFDGDLVPTFGWRKDAVYNYDNAGPVNAVTGQVATDFSLDPRSRTQATGESKSWGGVYHIPASIMSKIPGNLGLSASLFYDRSSNFKADVPRQDLIGDTLPNALGQTKEYGFTLGALNDRITLKVDWYHTLVANDTFQPSNGNNIGGLGSNGYFIWAAPSWGLIFASELQDGLQGKNPNNNWNYAAADGVPGAAAGANSAAYQNSQEGMEAPGIVNAWLHLPIAASYFSYYGMNPLPINPALGAASGQISSDFGPGYSESFNPGSEEWSGTSNAVTTVDTLSTGQEYELSAQPLKNWNLTANFVRTFATHENIDPTTTEFMATMAQFMEGPAGQLRLFTTNGAQGAAIGPQWITDIYDPYLVEVHTEGLSAPEVAPWRLNLTTSYTFDRGLLKGLFVGGGDRTEAGRILGYPYDPAIGFLNVRDPFIGSVEQYFDGWVGYKHRLFKKKIDWRIQVNLRNIGQKTELVPATYEPDGTLALERIQEGMTWQLTNEFDF